MKLRFSPHLITLFCFLLVLGAVQFALAASTGTPLYNPLGLTDPRLIVGRLVQIVIGLSGVAALVMFIWGGVQYTVSQGDPSKTKKAKDTLTYAIIGLVVLFASYIAVSSVITLLGGGSL